MGFFIRSCAYQVNVLPSRTLYQSFNKLIALRNDLMAEKYLFAAAAACRATFTRQPIEQKDQQRSVRWKIL